MKDSSQIFILEDFRFCFAFLFCNFFVVLFFVYVFVINLQLTRGPLYSQWGSTEAIIINVIGVVIAAAAISITFTLSVPSIRNKTPMRMPYHTDL